MPATDVVSVRLPVATIARIDQIATGSHRDRQSVLKAALQAIGFSATEVAADWVDYRRLINAIRERGNP